MTKLMKPRCLVNLTNLDPPVNGGLSNYARMVCRWLLDLKSEDRCEVAFVVNADFVPKLSEWLGRDTLNVIPFKDDERAEPIVRYMLPDVIISPLFGPKPFTACGVSHNIPMIAMVPDCLALDLPYLFSESELSYRRATYDDLKLCDRVLTLSEHARNRLLSHTQLPAEKILLTPWNVVSESSQVLAPVSQQAPVSQDVHKRLAELGVRQPYLFYGARDWPHKRHVLLLKIFALLRKQRPELQLVLSGNFSRISLDELCGADSDLRDAVLCLGYVDDSLVPALYRNAEALVHVSEYEGFGIPMLEAMTFGCPVVASNKTSIPEVVGDAGLLIESDQPEDWADAILKVLPSRRLELIETGFARAASFTQARSIEPWARALERVLRSREASLASRAPNRADDWTIPSVGATEEIAFWCKRAMDNESELAAKQAVIDELSAAAKAWEQDAVAKRNELNQMKSDHNLLARVQKFLKR